MLEALAWLWCRHLRGWPSRVPKLPVTSSSRAGGVLLKDCLVLQREGKSDSPGSWIRQMPSASRGAWLPACQGLCGHGDPRFCGRPALPANPGTSLLLLLPGMLSDALHREESPLLSLQVRKHHPPTPILSGCIAVLVQGPRAPPYPVPRGWLWLHQPSGMLQGGALPSLTPPAPALKFWGGLPQYLLPAALGVQEAPASPDAPPRRGGHPAQGQAWSGRAA